MEAQTTNFSLQPTNACVWKSLEWTEPDVDVEMIATFLKKGDVCLSTRMVLKHLPPTSTNKSLFPDDIFKYHRVNVGNGRQWSRNLVAESRRSAVVSAAPTSSEGIFNVNIHPHTVDLEDVQLEETLTEVETTKAAQAPQVVCEELPTEEVHHESEHLDELEHLHTKQQNKIKLQDFDDLAVLPDEVTDEVEAQPKDKSIRRRFLNFLNDRVHDHYMKKIERTHQRELEEGDEFYPTNFYFFYPMTRAIRERQKRRKWLSRDRQRQNIKDRLDAYWEEKRNKKEALRIEEEERYEKWAKEHQSSVSDSHPNEPKARMTKWEKRFLRAKELFS